MSSCIKSLYLYKWGKKIFYLSFNMCYYKVYDSHNQINMNDLIQILEKVWLTKKEASVYLTSLSLGQSPASILGERVWIARSTAQYTCNALVEKKLLNVVAKWNSFLYSPEPPEKVITMLNKEYLSIEKKMSYAQKIMGELNTIANPHVKLASVKFFSWVEWIIEMFEDVLNDDNDIYWFLQISDEMNKEIFTYLNSKYAKERSKLWMKSYSIFNKSDLWEVVCKNSRSVNREVVLIDRELYPIESCIQIYGDKVAFYSYKNDDLTWVVINNKNMAITQKALFDGMWKLAQQLSL